MFRIILWWIDGELSSVQRQATVALRNAFLGIVSWIVTVICLGFAGLVVTEVISVRQRWFVTGLAMGTIVWIIFLFCWIQCANFVRILEAVRKELGWSRKDYAISNWTERTKAGREVLEKLGQELVHLHKTLPPYSEVTAQLRKRMVNTHRDFQAMGIVSKNLDVSHFADSQMGQSPPDPSPTNQAAHA